MMEGRFTLTWRGRFGRHRGDIGALSASVSAMSFQKTCLKFLRRNGWVVVSENAAEGAVAHKNQGPVCLLFAPPGETGCLSKRQDWMEWRARQAEPVVVVMYEPASQELELFGRETKMVLLNYRQISILEDLGALLP
jgi:hypothetical protein